jgi:hypothetical protein
MTVLVTVINNGYFFSIYNFDSDGSEYKPSNEEDSDDNLSMETLEKVTHFSATYSNIKKNGAVYWRPSKEYY